MKTEDERLNQEIPLTISTNTANRLIRKIRNDDDSDGSMSLATMLAYLYKKARITGSKGIEDDLLTFGKAVFDHSEASFNAFKEFADRCFNEIAEYPKAAQVETDNQTDAGQSKAAEHVPTEDEQAMIEATTKLHQAAALAGSYDDLIARVGAAFEEIKGSRAETSTRRGEKG
jgi:cbb3-type cytochrome oxidase cytochrome c subunit